MLSITKLFISVKDQHHSCKEIRHPYKGYYFAGITPVWMNTAGAARWNMKTKT
jgi:hypothetical protein